MFDIILTKTEDGMTIGRNGGIMSRFFSGPSFSGPSQALHEGGSSKKLEHGDRITIGPCRLLGLWCEHPLSAEEKDKWTYEAAVDELMHQVIRLAFIRPDLTLLTR